MALLKNPWEHKFHLGGLYGQSAGVTAAERWDALWQSNYDITTDLFGFGPLRYAHDDFSGFQHQDSLSAGLGYKILNTDTTKLSAQVGVGYRQDSAALEQRCRGYGGSGLLPSADNASPTSLSDACA